MKLNNSGKPLVYHLLILRRSIRKINPICVYDKIFRNTEYGIVSTEHDSFLCMCKNRILKSSG